MNDQTPPFRQVSGWASRIRERLTCKQYQQDRRYAFALEARPYTPAELRILVKAAIWERFSGWEPENDWQVPEVVVDTLLEFGQLVGNAHPESP